ncbi:MAG: hypothetical protein ABWU84_07670 [Pyrobaculum sp.]
MTCVSREAGTGRGEGVARRMEIAGAIERSSLRSPFSHCGRFVA